MKQIFYGPSGCGKSHTILHGIQNLNKRIIILTMNGNGQQEFSHVGINDIQITPIPVKKTDNDTWHVTYDGIPIEAAVKGIYCFEQDVYTLPMNNLDEHSKYLEVLTEWLEKNRIADDPDNIIIFLNVIPLWNCKEINKIAKRISKWMADVILEHTVSETDADYELSVIRQSGKWFEILTMPKNYQNNILGKQTIN